MAHAYTPGLRVTGSTIIDKMRRLPLKGEVVVKVGDMVKAEDVVAKTALPGNVHTVNVANMLSLPPEDVKSCMLKHEGDAVENGEVIAMAKSFFGLFKSSAKANTTGVIENISEVTGQVTLREAPIPVEVLAYIDGKVTEVMEGEGVMVESHGAFLQGIFGIGGERVGTLKVLVSDPHQEMTPDQIKDVKGHVIVVGSHASYDLIMKARDAGAIGIVAGGIADSDLKRILGFDLGVAITGSEEIGVTVVVTEGFGTLGIAKKSFELLKKLEGEKVSVNGATQIRAGVMRPEILVPLDVDKGHATTTDMFEGGLQVGSNVRLIRQPAFGNLGIVTDMPPELQPLESEAKVRVLKAKVDGHGELTVPRANVEMIEG
ncbi:MAG: hypothetical protein HKN21_02695 [Candidatus Eisenbacteria bacterium]|uniref:KOW domain-containing protein n=1 Tax=Eiseniibacteriota bacterium TaxID=2212470 RepID=A0A7Y2H1H0_UNCEI|nr:hypothetical protein [Candidatus Eisenbacteria bacterium]